MAIFLRILFCSVESFSFLLLFFFVGQLNDTQQELKENNELVVELQGDLHLRVSFLNRLVINLFNKSLKEKSAITFENCLVCIPVKM